MIRYTALFSGLLSSIALPFTLVLLSRFSWIKLSLGSRFKYSVCICSLFYLISYFSIDKYLQISFSLFSFLSGASLLLGSTLVIFVIWSIICWGFTLNMLIVIDDSQRLINEMDWVEGYSGSQSYTEITINRIGIITKFRLGDFTNKKLIIRNNLGIFVFYLLDLIKRFF